MVVPAADELGAEARLGTVQLAVWLAVLAVTMYPLRQLGYEPLGVGVVAATVASIAAVATDRRLRERGWGAGA